MTEQVIEKMVGRGFKRWTKGNLDRLYINASQLGLVCSRYNTGNIKHAEFNGDSISNSHARRMYSAKTFVDCKTGKVHGDDDALCRVAEKILKEVSENVSGC